MRSRAGMTLLELIIALTISALAMTAGYAAFGMLVDRRKQVAEATDGIARAAAMRRSLEDWLAGAHLTVEENGPTFRGVDGVFDRRSDDDVTFLTNAPTPLGSAETIVHLYIVHDSAAPAHGLVAEFSEWGGAGTATSRAVIDERVTSLDAEYLSGLLGERKWLPSWISSSVLPAGIRLTLGAAKGDSLAPLLRVPVLVPLGGGR
jgi:prepilin-type N-terminal cleavage/methylation domain-containing protein